MSLLLLLRGASAGGGEAPAAPPAKRKPPLGLDVEAETAEGILFPLSANDPNPANRPSGITFTTQRGDGFGTASYSLNRPIFRDHPDLNLLDTHRFIGHQGDIAYEGRAQSFPRQNDPAQTISPQLAGWMTYLKGRPMPALVIDRRGTGWQEASNQRRANMVSGGYRYEASPQAGFQTSGALGPGVVFTFATFDGAFKEIGEAWFFAGGEEIGALRYDFVAISGAPEAAFNTLGFLCSDDVASAFVPGVDLDKTTTAGQEVSASGSTGMKWALLQDSYTGATVGTSNEVHAFLYPRVIGTHGLTARGASPQEGYYVSDIIDYLLRTYRPKIEWAGQTNTFPVQQCTWHDSPSNVYDAIQQLNNLVLWETNVWEDQKLYFEPADLTKNDWQFKTTDPGVSVNFQGDSIENFANGVVITYTDFFEHTYKLFPSDHPELRDESENNAATRHGEELWIEKTVPWPCLEGEALQFGRATLIEYNRPKRPGSYTITGGYIKDAAGHWRQGWQVRSSQTLSVMDHPSESEPRLITATNWDQDTLTLTITVDAPPQTLEAIVARNELALQAQNLT